MNAFGAFWWRGSAFTERGVGTGRDALMLGTLARCLEGIFSAGVRLLEQFGTLRVHADRAQFHALVQILKKSIVIMCHCYACPLLPWEDVGFGLRL